MTTNHHTPIPSGAAADDTTFNGPLSELDTEITAQDGRIGTLEGDMPVPSGDVSEFYNGLGGFSVPAGTGSTNGHVIQDEGVDQTQRAKINFTGAGVTVVDTAGATEVQISSGGVSDHGALTGLADDDHPQYLLATGLREWSEQASNPTTPASTKWKLFFKAGGLYTIDDAGAVVGPLGAADENAVTSLIMAFG